MRARPGRVRVRTLGREEAGRAPNDLLCLSIYLFVYLLAKRMHLHCLLHRKRRGVLGPPRALYVLEAVDADAWVVSSTTIV